MYRTSNLHSLKSIEKRKNYYLKLTLFLLESIRELTNSWDEKPAGKDIRCRITGDLKDKLICCYIYLQSTFNHEQVDWKLI